MTEEHSKELIAICPELFETKIPPRAGGFYGFECGDGWFDLLKDLLIKIREGDSLSLMYVLQAKEKFGTLRFYIRSAFPSTRLDELIGQAEVRSSKTCEICGEPGVRRGGGWIKTLCEEHHLEREAKKTGPA